MSMTNEQAYMLALTAGSKATAAATVSATEAWLAEHVDPDTGYVIDDTLAVTGAAADAKKVGDEISDLKSALTGDGLYTLFSDYPQYKGRIDNGVWKDLTSNGYKHIVIPVNESDAFSVNLKSGVGRLAFLKSYAPVADAAVDFSEAEGFTSLISLTANTEMAYTIPSDVTYVYLSVYFGWTNTVYNSVYINGLDIMDCIVDNVSRIATDLDEAQEDIEIAQSDITALNSLAYYGDISSYPQDNGFLVSSTGKWNYTAISSYKHKCVPIRSGDKIHLVAGANNTTYAVLKTYTPPSSDGGVADFSTAEGFTSAKSLSANQTADFTVPSDGTYLYLYTLSNNIDITPTVVSINGLDIAKNIPKNIAALYGHDAEIDETLTDNAEELDSHADSIQKFNNALDFPLIANNVTRGNINTSTFKWENCTSSAIYPFYHSVVPVQAGDKVSVIGPAVGYTYIGFLKSYTTPADGESADMTDDVTLHSVQTVYAVGADFIVPSDTTYLYIMTVNNNSNVMPQSVLVNGADLANSVRANIQRLNNKWDTDVNWCAMGDSIVSGYYSIVEGGEPDSRYDPKVVWPAKVAEMNHWTLTNMGIGGGGYYHEGSGNTPRGYVLARQIDYTPFNLVTIAYGTNDWGNDVSMGSMEDDPTAETINAFIPAMRATLEAIIESNPLCKVIVILPFNRKKNTATESDNWALGYELTNTGTLESFCQKMIEVCNYYGIQYIDAAHSSIVNRKNLPEVLLDGIHPSIDGHYAIAHELAKKITF